MSIVVSSNRLGLKNKAAASGVAHLALSAAIGATVAVAWLDAPDDLAWEWSGESLLRHIAQWWVVGVCVVSLLASFAHLWRGLHMIFGFVEPANVPAGIHGAPESVYQLLWNRSIVDTYQLPTSLDGKIVFRLLPQFYFLSPTGRRPSRGIWLIALTGGVAAIAYSWVGSIALWLLASCCCSLLVRIATLSLAASKVRRADGEAVQQTLASGVIERKVYLTSAGDPVALFQKARDILGEQFRTQKFENRTLMNEPPHRSAKGGGIASRLVVETQPLPIAGATTNGILLDVGAVLVAMAGWGLLLLSEWDSLLALIGVLVVWGGALLISLDLFRIAHSVHNSFCFQSELYWVGFEGSWQRSKVGVGGVGAAVISEREGVSSELWLKIRTAQIKSECAPGLNEHENDVQQDATEKVADAGALSNPRSIIATIPSQRFIKRTDDLLAALAGFRDQSRALAAPEIDAATTNAVAPIGSDAQHGGHHPIGIENTPAQIGHFADVTHRPVAPPQRRDAAQTAPNDDPPNEPHDDQASRILPPPESSGGDDWNWHHY